MGMVSLGRDTETDSSVTLADEDRQRGLYIIGKTGTGKTTLIENLAVQDMEAGLGLCVLDPHGDLVARLLKRIPKGRSANVVLLDPRDSEWPFGLNPFWSEQEADAETCDRLSGQFVELIEKLWGPKGSEGTSWGPNIPMLLRHIGHVFVVNRGMTLVEIRDFLSDKAYRQKAVAAVSDEYVRSFWAEYDAITSRQEQRSLISSTLNKIDGFVSQSTVRHIVGQSRTTANLREFMDEGAIVLVPLSLGRLGEPAVSLLGSLMILQVLNAALSRESTPESGRRQFNVYADEYQRFSTPAFAELLSEARKYGVATTIAHQYRSQLDENNRDAALNAGNLVVFGVHGEDAEQLAKQFDKTPPLPPYASHQPKLAIAGDAVHELLHSDSQDLAVRSAIEKILEPITTGATSGKPLQAAGEFFNDLDAHWFADWGCYHTTPVTCKNGLALINQYLADMMSRRVERRSQQHLELVQRIAELLRGPLCIAPGDVPVLSRQRVGRAGNVEDQDYDFEDEWFPPESAQALRRITEASMLRHPDQDAVQRAKDDYERIRTAYWESRLIPEAQDLAPKRAHLEAVNAVGKVVLLGILGERLWAQPLYVNSAEWEPVRDRADTYANVQAAIANSLTNLPAYRARYKLVQGRTTIEGELETEYVSPDYNVRPDQSIRGQKPKRLFPTASCGNGRNSQTS